MPSNVKNIKNDFRWLYNDKYQHVEWEDFLVHWHDSVGEYCIYINDKWSGYVDEYAIYKSGRENAKRWNEYWEQYRQHEIHIDYHYTIMRLCNTPNMDITVLTGLISNRSYPQNYKIKTLTVLRDYFIKNDLRSTDDIEKLIQEYEHSDGKKTRR